MSPRYQIEDTRDAMKHDLEEALNDVRLQYDLYLAALAADNVEATVFSDDDTVGLHVEGDDPMQLRQLSVEVGMSWMTVLDRGESGDDWIVLVSAAEIGRKYLPTHRTVCECGSTLVEHVGDGHGAYAWEGHLGVCLATPEDSAQASEDG